MIMFVCICRYDLFLTSQPNSLKAKRQIIKSLQQRIRNKFQVSVAETGKNDLWQRAEIGIAFVASDYSLAESIYSQLQKMFDAESQIEIIEEYMDIQNFKH